LSARFYLLLYHRRRAYDVILQNVIT